MKLFAVILASIAALAATAQTYFIWSNKSDVFARGRITLDKDGFKSMTCRQLMSASASLNRLNQSAETIIARTADQYRNMIVERDSETSTDMEKVEHDAINRGRLDFMSEARMTMYRLSEFVDTDYIYFTEEELSDTGYSKWRSLIEQHGRQFRYGGYGVVEVSDEQFNLFQNSVKEAGDQHGSIKEVCTPILLRQI